LADDVLRQVSAPDGSEKHSHTKLIEYRLKNATLEALLKPRMKKVWGESCSEQPEMAPELLQRFFA
jgi:hypothetical protein